MSKNKLSFWSEFEEIAVSHGKKWYTVNANIVILNGQKMQLDCNNILVLVLQEKSY